MPQSLINDLTEAIRGASAPHGVQTTIAAIDGLGGSGKSSLAALVGQALDAPVVCTDDFASWENPVDWWPHLLEKVLVPLAAGRPSSFVPNTWGGPPKEPVVVDPGGIVLLEGVTSTRRAFRPYLAYAVWVETPREIRLRRGLQRDGESALPDWERWMREEDAYVRRERPAEYADVVVPGDAGLWS